MKEETEVVQENGELGDEVKNLGKGVGVRTIKLKGTPLIEFNLEDNRLIVERICGKHLTNMGKPLGKGVELQAEEAVYMLENGIGLITMKGKYLNLAEAYHFVLQRCNVPFYEYSVYSMLKKHGFVVKRCKLLHQANQKPTTSNDFDTNQQLLQKEETLNGEKSDEKWPNLATGTGLTLRSEALKHLFGQTDGVKIEYTGLMYSPKIRLLNKKPCRPEWLPCLESIKQADNWKTWRDKRKRMMNKKLVNCISTFFENFTYYNFFLMFFFKILMNFLICNFDYVTLFSYYHNV
ncbi:hypothetical protein WR25_02879 [Diploscapter pachys]|uniref:tRNA-splicing endonuclease subunit Sen54 N-terminal domain-containing protein n=1 Tax=Diploscapter pachys TaxID=2018661 RepID=A0A2A2LEX5_9BILA|nr:hypothetical protein WR25_02879 [Diploscapter pachys]